jgi:hypothetical protein
VQFVVSIAATMFFILAGANISAYAVDLAHVDTAPSGVAYATGGVGKASADKMKELAAGRDFNVKLTFAWNTGNFLADIPVMIEDAAGKKVLDLAASGPILLVDLPQGRYTVAARYRGKLEKRVIAVAKGGKQAVHFTWQPPQG